MLLAPTACSTVPPHAHDTACEIFSERRSWWRSVRASEDRWGVPPEVQLAIIGLESGFVDDARPPRRGGFLFIPGRRASSAFGYAQAVDGTWDWYREDAGRPRAQRDRFDDAADFVGWYARKSQALSGIPLSDARNQYLAYHEGHAGYNRGSHRDQAWLMRKADRAAALAARYRAELSGCARRLDRRWPF